MTRRTLGFALFAVLVAAGCVRLGLWQLQRLEERRERNRVVADRLDGTPVEWTNVLRDSATARYRAITVEGVFDYEREVVLTSRTRRGAPGVHILTPLRLADGSFVLVNRGWVYSPDGTTVDLSRWREGDSARVAGYLEDFESLGASGPVSTTSNVRGIRRLVRDSVARRIGAPLAPLVVVRRDGAGFTGGEVQHPFRVDVPALNDGSHRSYAIQWFSFALIAVVGTGFVLWRGKERGASGSPLSAGRR